ncbi:hypothetical protein POKO110462_14535 [Pontibacter korlensis]|uniref:Outer membrane protein beta-barrel domain-containing protein n=1 Tax=Pontibacter korlensis TaxID=400092 RepID=A0A0E3UYM3_9BACT|nr:hypothetical protein [Pontibacter korlensis]AKD05267.1 hypothetical protein PKOR_22115 [Pontibacter korlensis]
MKYSVASLSFGACFLVLLLSQSFAASGQTFVNGGAGKEPAALKAGVNFVWLSENDSQGMMFSNSFSHYVGKRLSVGLNLGLLSAKRYDDAKQIYTVQNTFYMGSLEAAFDVMQGETVSFRLGAGPSARHRAEVNSDPEGQGTQDGSVTHIKTSDVGFHGFFENDFNILRNGVAGGRVSYFHYTEGTPILSIGLHLGFKF